MFGIKIISKSEYEKFQQLDRCWSKEEEVYKKNILELSKDCESLREQLNEKIKKVKELEEELSMSGSDSKLRSEVRSLREFKRDTLEAMGQIDLAGFRLSYCTKKCSKCANRERDCKKYQFGTHEYCVIPK